MSVLSIPQVERLIKISKEKPLLPQEFVPWKDEPTEDNIFLPEQLISLHGHPLYDTLTLEQKKELGRHEVVQVMYSYGWSEGLACLFFNRHLLTLQPDNVEYRFLLRELIEEFQHQEMFAEAVKKLNGKPISPSFAHRMLGKITVNYFPSPTVFMSVLAVEHMADIYGKMMRKDKNVFSVLRKVSELHHIEEGRHIYYTELWLKRFTENAGFVKRTWYSLIVMFNILFMRTLYVKTEIFERIGVDDPKKYQKAAYNNFKKKFGRLCLDESIEFVNSFNGFNWLTRPFWKFFLKRDDSA